ncbi:MAG: hypothetical protein R2939_19380 [Kofleriaceae bacterium]
MRYKFVELSVVTEDALEGCVNRWVAEGWSFDGVRFVMSEASRRPVMAFVSFVRDDAAPAAAPPPPTVDDDGPPPPRRRRTAAPPPIELGELELPEGDEVPLEPTAAVTGPDGA